MATDDHAVVVGITTYRGFDPLEGPERDAMAFADWLEESAGGQVPSSQVHRILTSQFSSVDQPGRDDIDQIFRPLVTKVLTEGRAGRRLYVFLAGHGFSDPSSMEGAALYTANAEFLFTPHVAGTLYAEWFRRNAGFSEIVLVMDCCRTVSGLNSLAPPPFPASQNIESGGSVRTFLAYATEWGQETREMEIDGVNRGVFTTALVEALRHAPPNRLGRVTGEIVKNFVHHRLSAETTPPKIEVNSHRDLALVTRDTETQFPVRVRLSPALPAAKLRITDGQNELVREIEASQASTGALSLPPGLFKVAAIGTPRQTLFEVAGATDVDL